MRPLNRYIFFCGLIFILSFSTCKKNAVKEREDQLQTREIIGDITTRSSAWADSVLIRMTLEERVGQCLMPALPSSGDAHTLRELTKYIEDYHIGGIVLGAGDLESAKKIGNIVKESNIPLFVAIDAEWGLGMRLKDASIYPRNGNLSHETDETYMFDYGREVAEESREAGINMILGPVVDIVSFNNGIIGKRSFGKDPLRVSELGVAYAKGLESGGVISVAKHFPGHGGARFDSHISKAVLDKDILTLDSVDLKPFRHYIDSGLSGIMAGHISAKALDPDGLAASVSMDMLTSLLREEMGFKGLVLTDAFDMGGVKGFTATEALKAGADLILCPKDLSKEFRELINSVNSGKISPEVINDRCRRILFYKALFLEV